ncbi:MAG: SLBB domain-containing protein [Fimbriimonadaceae bacterium]|nr:SLBB domain-containing protein [Chthonomonadaceae bacterium]MCO5297318.1 SLBB domain-containing protein [Fimbriimonadaceae bacterium]
MKIGIVLVLALGLVGWVGARQDPTPPSKPAAAAYVVGPEDVLGIVTRDVAEASGEFLVRADGQITFPLIGEVRVAGKTLEQIRAEITDRLKHELRDPEVQVNVKQMRPNRVYVLGQVRAAGALDAKPGWHLAELIAAAGGLAMPPERLKAVVFRPSGTVSIEMRELFIDAKESANIPIFPGDVVHLSSEPTIRVSVVGEVQHPGLIDLVESGGVVEAIAAAGGQTQKAGLSRARIVRGSEQIPVDLHQAILLGNPATNVPLRDGDTIYVPEHKAKVSVMGMVGKPGTLEIPDGEGLTFVQALGRAGGPIRDAKMDGITLARADATGKIVPKNYNYKDILAGRKDASDFALQDGDVIYVAQSGKANANQVAQILGLLFSGGRLFGF